VVISDQGAHLPRLRANIDLNRELLRQSRAILAAKANVQGGVGDDCTTKVPHLMGSVAGDDTGKTEAETKAVERRVVNEVVTTGESCDGAATQADAGGCVLAAELEWGDSDAIARVLGGKAFDVVVCCETLHWPALDLWQVSACCVVAPNSFPSLTTYCT